ncbi:MAG: ATP-grasp domain-containing protein, partial [Candidatus Kapaibacterium sp.]
ISSLGIPCPPWGTSTTENEAVDIADRIGYPVLVRPSYVLGGRAMQICYREDALRSYMRSAIAQDPTRPVLIDHFLENALEFDVDAISDGTTTVIGGIMQHIEEAGIHSGDSSCVLPPYNVGEDLIDTMRGYARAMAEELKVVGLMNIQFAVQNGTVYVLEVNPRASRTVPFVSKATGVQLAQLATRVMTGEPLVELAVPEFTTTMQRTAIKESVFPFAKFPHASVFLGPEMRSTGEVMGMDRSFGRAIIKSHISSGNGLPVSGNVFISLSTHDKTPRAVELAGGYRDLGFTILATRGTADFLGQHGVHAQAVLKHYEGRPSIIDQIANGEVQIVINTPLGENARYDEAVMGRTAMKYKVPFFTTLAAAEASLQGIYALGKESASVMSLQDHYAGTAS